MPGVLQELGLLPFIFVAPEARIAWEVRRLLRAGRDPEPLDPWDELVAMKPVLKGHQVRLTEVDDVAAPGLEFRVVLVCTPRILPTLDPSAELRQRIAHVFFSRYRDTEPAEYTHFCRAVRTCLGRLGDSSFRPTDEHLRLLLRGSVGCVGELILWTTRALIRCMRANNAVLGWEHFLATAMSGATLEQLLRQCREGEERHALAIATTIGADLNWEDDGQSDVSRSTVSSDTLRTASSKQRQLFSGRIGIPKPKHRSQCAFGAGRVGPLSEPAAPGARPSRCRAPLEAGLWRRPGAAGSVPSCSCP